MAAMNLIRRNHPKKKKAPGGQRNPLKRLISDMEIKGDQSVFLGKIWPRLCPAWLDFEKFGVGFEKSISAFSSKPALPPDANVACENERHRGWRSLDSIPKSTLEARPRGVAPTCFSKTIISAGQEAVRPSQVEYR
jgi:hypothetical protein